MTAWPELVPEARRRVERVADDPDGRLRLRMAFYRRFGRGKELLAAGRLAAADPDAEFGYGRSELDFLRWEIRRGVLNPPDGSRGSAGSPWWRAVNGAFLLDGELATLGVDAGLGPEGAPAPVAAWLGFIAGAGERAWYRAHNTSIVAGYAMHAGLAAAEARPEQIFVNMVLYRLLFAQALVEGVEFGELGRFLANPRLPSVDVLVHLPDFYPDHYPLTRADVRRVMHQGHGLEGAATLCLDQVLIHPQLVRLYARAADWDAAPDLPAWVAAGEPVYPSLRSASPWLRAAGRWLRRGS